MSAPTAETNLAASADLIGDFVDESLLSLRNLPQQMEAFRAAPDNDGAINAVFRAIHSIKGCAGFLNLLAVKKFAHTLENTLDEVRKRNLQLTEPLSRAIIDGFDLLDSMLARAADGALDEDLTAAEAALLGRVESIAGQCTQCAAVDSKHAALLALAEEIAASGAPRAKEWGERLRALCQEGEAAAAGGVGTQGEAAAETDEGESAAPVAQPTWESFLDGPLRSGELDLTEDLRGLLELFRETAAGRYQEETGAAFLDRCESCRARISDRLPGLAAAIDAAQADFRILYHSPLGIDSSLLTIVWDRLAAEFNQLRPQNAAPLATTAAPAKEDIPAAGGPSSAAKAGATAQAKTGGGEPSRAKTKLVRVKEARLDQFLENVSRLFITCELYKDVHQRMLLDSNGAELVEEFRQINRTFSKQTAMLRQDVVALRQVSVAGLFSKFPTMARSLAAQLGKKIDVHLSGEEVELDKNMVEDLDAPLTHMIRNVVDHAIELPEERQRRGVSETGNLWLRAEATRTRVTIIVRDDGRGVDPDRLRRKAIEKGLLTADQAARLSDQEAVELIFAAGLSTAEKLSEISGRGVGMDVVRTTLREHAGEVSVESKVGVGTTFRLDLPVKEAVLVVNGLLLEQAGETYVLPFENVFEISELCEEDLHDFRGDRMVKIRDELHHAVNLSDLLNVPARDRESGEKYPAVVVGAKQQTFCLIVDRIVGHRQVVVNSIREILPSADKLAGVAQLGGGRLALVLSVPDLLRN